jgi:hypothetical protein
MKLAQANELASAQASNGGTTTARECTLAEGMNACIRTPTAHSPQLIALDIMAAVCFNPRLLRQDSTTGG